MRTIVAICAALLLLSQSGSAAERPWQAGVWAPRDNGHYVIETATDVVTADETSATGQLDATAGQAVQVAVDGSSVYVLDAARSEHRLTLVSSARKYATSYAAVGSGHYITAVSPGGTRVQLEDGSRWDIDPRRHFAVAAWQADDLISVRRSSDDPDFAYEVDNTSRDEGTPANYRVR